MSDDQTHCTDLERARNGDKDAWHRIVNTYAPIIYRKCRLAGFGEEDTKELSQEIFIKLWNGLSSFRRDPPRWLFRKWLAVLVRNACNDVRDKRKTRPEYVVGDFDRLCDSLALQCEEETAFTLKDSDMQMAMREAMRRVECATSEKHWRAFWRTEIESHPAREVADDLELKVDNVRQIRKRVFQAIVDEVRLQGMLDEEERDESD